MKFSVTILCACSVFAGMGATCRAQSAPTPPPNTTIIPEKTRTADYATLGSLPDWSGIWVLNFPKRGDAPPEEPSFTPAAAAELKVLQDEEAKNEEPATESANCVPPGMPQIMFQPYDVEFLFTPGRVTIIQEAYMQVRRVFTDGRGHPASLDPTFNGDSIGHWEGDTLVIDTIGLGHRLPLGYNRMNHGPKMQVVERIRMTSPDTLEDRMTLTDPDVLAQPWHTVHTFTRHREWNQLEFICEENNRNPINDKTGQVSTILGKDK